MKGERMVLSTARGKQKAICWRLEKGQLGYGREVTHLPLHASDHGGGETSETWLHGVQGGCPGHVGSQSLPIGSTVGQRWKDQGPVQLAVPSRTSVDRCPMAEGRAAQSLGTIEDPSSFAQPCEEPQWTLILNFLLVKPIKRLKVRFKLFQNKWRGDLSTAHKSVIHSHFLHTRECGPSKWRKQVLSQTILTSVHEACRAANTGYLPVNKATLLSIGSWWQTFNLNTIIVG